MFNDKENESKKELKEENNFVELPDKELLLFVQKSIREKNTLEKELDTVQGTYDDTLAKNKADFINHEDVVKYTTQKERMIALDKLAEDNIDYILLNEMSEIKNKINNIKNELDLAREIYRLKNI